MNGFNPDDVVFYVGVILACVYVGVLVWVMR